MLSPSRHSVEGATTDTEPGRAPTAVLVGTLDTKGREYGFLVDRTREPGVDVLVLDAGILEANGLSMDDLERTVFEVRTLVAGDLVGTPQL